MVNVKRSAFTLIELIFAIVIIAISVVSIPIMTNAIGKGVENNLIQEGIFGASAKINQILSYRWDENSIDESVDVNATGLAKVIDRNGTSCNGDRLKPGHIFEALHRKCLDNNATRVSITFGSDGESVAEYDDVDDFTSNTGDLFTGSSSSDAYKQAYTYEVTVNTPTLGITGLYDDEVKEVVVTVKIDGQDITELKAYTFNIGEVEYYKRMY